MTATYKDGKAQGPYVEHRDGKPAVTGQFVADQKDGTWTQYDADGSVMLTATYKAGVLDGPVARSSSTAPCSRARWSPGGGAARWTRTDRAGSVSKLTYTTP